jgi:hypothetical protein
MSNTLDALIETARVAWNGMTKEERAAMIEEQRRSYARAEVMFGSDADEAAMADAIARGDEAEVARLREAEEERGRTFDAIWRVRG